LFRFSKFCFSIVIQILKQIERTNPQINKSKEKELEQQQNFSIPNRRLELPDPPLTQLLVERAFRCKNLQEPSCSSKVFKSLCSPQKAGWGNRNNQRLFFAL